MNEKSHVSLEQQVCLVCGHVFDTGAILLDRRLRPSLELHTQTGWGLCSEHKRLFDDGFVALIECDPARSAGPAGDVMRPQDAYRTGRLAHLRREAFARLIDVDLHPSQPCVFVEPGVIDRLLSLVRPPTAH